MSLPSVPEHSVELSSADARELVRLLGLLLKRQPGPDWIALRSGGTGERSSRVELIEMANALLRERKRRSERFNPVMFGEAAWEMLLALYISEFEGQSQTIGKLINSIGAPQTTALRWIDYLEKERLISREPHPRDRRTVIVRITDKGRERLDEYLSTISLRVTSDASTLLPGLRGGRGAGDEQSETEEKAGR